MFDTLKKYLTDTHKNVKVIKQGKAEKRLETEGG